MADSEHPEAWRVLDVLVKHGGEKIVAGPPMDRLCNEIAALIDERRAAQPSAEPGLNVERLAEAIRLWYVEVGRNPVTGSYDQPRASWLIAKYVALTPDRPTPGEAT